MSCHVALSYPDGHHIMAYYTRVAPTMAADSRLLPSVPLEAVVPWVLAQGGEAVVLEPQMAVEAVKKAAKAILDAAENLDGTTQILN